jgi:hypothetical protein
LQQLRVLELSCAVFDPAHLASLTQLQRLRLQYCGLLPFEAGDNRPPAQSTITLLAALNSLPNLEHLSRRLNRLDTEQNRRWFASLAASSKLASLKLDTTRYQPLPKRAASCIFFSRPLPQLQQLCTLVSAGDPEFDDVDGDGYCISKAELCCIVRSCPSLQKLDLRCTVTPGKDLSALQELQACRVLIVGGRGFADQQAEVIGQLTWLTELRWSNSPALTDVGLEQLTTLTNLGRLWLHGCYNLSNQANWMDKFELLSQHDKVRCLYTVLGAPDVEGPSLGWVYAYCSIAMLIATAVGS